MKGNGRPLKGLFNLGQILSTPGALDALRPYPGLGLKLLARHVSGDWGGTPYDGIDNCDLIAIR